MISVMMQINICVNMRSVSNRIHHLILLKKILQDKSHNQDPKLTCCYESKIYLFDLKNAFFNMTKNIL